jgi:hypothetical protein
MTTPVDASSLPMRKTAWSAGVGLVVLASACVPLPVSSVSLHHREERPAALVSGLSQNQGTFSSPAFDARGEFIATYDSGSNQIVVTHTSDLTTVRRFTPARRPRRLSFSPGGRFLVVEAHQGWVDDYLSGRPLPSHADVDSPEAIRDDIQRAEVLNLTTGESVHDLSCDAVETTPPKGGWLWARRKAITPGYRSAALLEAHVSADEREFSMLCWNGEEQRWDTGTWTRLASLPPPPFWNATMARTSAQWLAGDGAASRSTDARIVVFRARERRMGFSTTFVWDRQAGQLRRLPGDCATRNQPVQPLSLDGRRIVAVCNAGMGHALRVWDLVSGRPLPLVGAEFGVTRGAPVIRDEGIALSPDGRFLVAALLNLGEALVITPVPASVAVSRSDLRIWAVDDGHEPVSVPLDDQVRVADYFRGVDVAVSPDSAIVAVAGTRLRLYRAIDLGNR